MREVRGPPRTLPLTLTLTRTHRSLHYAAICRKGRQSAAGDGS